MAPESFDDEQLQNLAKYNLYANAKRIDGQRRQDIEKLVSKDKLDNSERNELVKFVSDNRYVKPKSMSDMKQEILAMIGASSSSYSQNTMSRQDVENIYNWFMSNIKKGGSGGAQKKV